MTTADPPNALDAWLERFLDHLINERVITSYSIHYTKLYDITDALTGMANRKATIQALAAQVTRSRRYGNLLSLGAMRLTHPDLPDIGLPDASILALAHYLRERLRWADIV